MYFRYAVSERGALNPIFDLAIRKVPSRVMSCPFWSVLANFERFLQA